MNKRMVSIVLGVLVAGGFVAAKYFVFPELEIQARKAAGTGWDEARPEIRGNVMSGMREAFVDIDLKQADMDKVCGCVTGKIVDFLNGTDCDYYFNESTTTEAEHMKKQEACLNEVGYDNKEMEFMIACSKQDLPKDWSIMRPLMAQEMDAAVLVQIPDAMERKQAVDCVVSKTIELLGTTDCTPVNPDATTPEQLFIPAEECFEKAGITAKAEEAIAACLTPVL